MNLDYATAFAQGNLKYYEHAFPAEADEDTESAESEVQEEPPQEGEQHREGDPQWRAAGELEPFDSAVPYDSAVPMESDEGGHLEAQPFEQEPPQEEQHRGGDPQEGPVVLDQRVLRRRGHRVRQLQRGFWIETDEESIAQLLQSTLDYVRQEGGEQWNKIDVNGDLGKSWFSLESSQAEVRLILCSASARRMKKPQPYFGPHEVPLRKSFLLLGNGQVLTTDWEMWSNQAPASQVRPLVAPDRQLYVVLYGRAGRRGRGYRQVPSRGREPTSTMASPASRAKVGREAHTREPWARRHPVYAESSPNQQGKRGGSQGSKAFPMPGLP